MYFSPNGTYVSMGDFEELAYAHSPRIKFGIGFSLAAEKGARYGFDCKYYRNPKTKLPKLHDLDYRAPAFSFQVTTGADGYTAGFANDPEKEIGFSASSHEGFRNAMERGRTVDWSRWTRQAKAEADGGMRLGAWRGIGMPTLS